jgi:PelA/Pel-15E family pectate lyase
MFEKPVYQVVVIAILFFLPALGYAQNSNTTIPALNTAIFDDAAHHWYGIADKHNVIQPSANQPKYQPTELAAIGDNILLYQKENGGWPKNYDILAILTPAQKDSLLAAKSVLNTTFDNRTTYSHITALATIYAATQTEKYKNAALKGLDYMLAAQYDNGGWPQYYPLENNYSRHITYNDDVYAGIIGLFKDITDEKPLYSFIDAKRRKKIQVSYEKGLDCILKTQINEDGVLTAWCQQHDEVTLQPAWARKFEPPCICSAESAKLVLLLMSIKKPSAAIINAIDKAYDWFNASKITGIRVETIKAPVDTTPYTISRSDRIVVKDAAAPAIWTRYYELKTHRPLFCNRDSQVVYSLAEVARERRTGYAWYNYEPQKVLDKYEEWKKKITAATAKQ